ncbi:hypothetical protein [Actinomyces sp. oral taxon 175]|uniref:hypothetical protein n=1 Tax=Actinomyces sp. oral taxon 175 TaxID=712119 RepID=UPI00021D4298|nr:hypothetical protein [Actinomyces sp. oral taxon 175]EGV13270.1 conserved domain protein [Actinomyces sp. oral taxon 175 str. F0384]
MTRSLARLSGRCRVASALGAGVLAASLALAGCSSSSPKGGGTIPPLNTAGASAASTTAPAASGGASSKGSAAPTTLDAQKLTDESIGYYVDFVPQRLDTTQTQAALGYLAYDRATWEAYRDLDGDLSAVEASTTGAALENYRKTYREAQESGGREVGTSRVTVMSVEIQSDSEAAVDVCSDQTQIKQVSESGKDITQPDWRHTHSYLVSVKLTDGAWKVASLEKKGTDIC